MSKGKKGGKRITRPLMEQKLEAFFRSHPGEAIPFKEVFRQYLTVASTLYSWLRETLCRL